MTRHNDDDLNRPSAEFNCYSCEHAVLSSTSVAATRLDHKAEVEIKCKVHVQNNHKTATYRYLMARCDKHSDWRET